MAKDGEVAHSFQPLMEGSRSFFWGAHGGQVADPMIEAKAGFDRRIGHFRPPQSISARAMRIPRNSATQSAGKLPPSPRQSCRPRRSAATRRILWVT